MKRKHHIICEILEAFSLSQGTGQGSLLFLIFSAFFLEVLDTAITQFLKIRGITLRKGKTKLSLYTDVIAYLVLYHQNSWIGNCISLLGLQ